MLKRLFVLLVFLFGGYSLLIASDAPPSFKADMYMEGGPGNMMQNIKIFFKDEGKMRQEMEVSGQKNIMILNGGKAYMYMPGQNMAMAIPMNKANKDVSFLFQERCSTTGQETVDGKLCEVKECQSQGEPVTVWIDKASKMALKIKTSATTVYFKNVVVGNLDESLFELPAGAKVMDMNNMMDMFTNKDAK